MELFTAGVMGFWIAGVMRHGQKCESAKTLCAMLSALGVQILHEQISNH